jgi:hypothetical protein
MVPLVDAGADDEDRQRRRETLRAIRDTYLAQLRQYRFPVITLTNDASLAAVCTVFEQLNTNQVRLGPFEILTAKFYKNDVSLRLLWDEARVTHAVFRDPAEENDHSGFSIDPYLLLQIITLETYGSPQRKAVLGRLTARDVQEKWDRVAIALRRVIEHLRDSCGVIHRDLLPYQMLLVPMTGAWLLRDSMPGPAKGRALEKINQYFWSSAFTTNFDQGGASQAERDYRDLKAWLNDERRDGVDVIPEAVSETLRISADTLLTATVAKKALLKGVMALTVREGAKDFHLNEPLTQTSYVDSKVNSHHLYPKGTLDNADPARHIPSEGHSSELILNRALIDADTNRRIGANKPSVYVAEMRDVGMDVETLLASHLIDAEALEADDYGAFLRARLTRLIEAVESATGKDVLPLIEDEPVDA